MSESLNLKEQFCFSLYNAQRQVNRYYSNHVFKKYKLTYPQFLVLTILWAESPVNVKKVVTELALDTGTVSPLLKRMEQMDLIHRERSEIDQREVYIHLTPKSEQIRPELDTACNDVAAASSLTQEEFKELNRLLDKVITAFNEYKKN
ncbi:MarR family transcriptional regulator, multiple gene regulator MgrA [Staphylococcus auricularis]|uniref:HTH-type transcriptional regulator MgrA n=1 Tax=Staphylococcus auricularis TaxID=29379 RepID=A0AAP8PQ81_9STAP|nr:MarR family transcriptional regulator [Staphylococcus auricularis]MBM0868603.1 MarR family transcriptional regulator [Staphylococcus auricularis]MCE5039458.1 MarR family transcriptional regulator [Staphylococcus auricularis]MCG7341411.1 MarR family transcriptional regulator [Staphylococcus auricularis]MDC6327504.1 MarR family transcriptional regulator [Staphylococcus auricularis]MDN4534087.1 MarR family transcriptional regulator [Staphylococcus auricularis]